MNYIVKQALVNKYSVCFTDVEIAQIEDDNLIFVNMDPLQMEISQCKSRFMVIRIDFSMVDGGHANYIIIDKLHKTAERYEPHHLNESMKEELYFDLIDHFFDTFFKFFFTDISYISPLQYCQKIPIGFQTVYDDKQDYYDDGLCALFALLYIEYRLHYPDTPREELLEQLRVKLETTYKSGTLGDYLRQFAQRYENKYLSESKEDKMHLKENNIMIGDVYEFSNGEFSSNEQKNSEFVKRLNARK